MDSDTSEAFPASLPACEKKPADAKTPEEMLEAIKKKMDSD